MLRVILQRPQLGATWGCSPDCYVAIKKFHLPTRPFLQPPSTASCQSIPYIFFLEHTSPLKINSRTIQFSRSPQSRPRILRSASAAPSAFFGKSRDTSILHIAGAPIQKAVTLQLHKPDFSNLEASPTIQRLLQERQTNQQLQSTLSLAHMRGENEIAQFHTGHGL